MYPEILLSTLIAVTVVVLHCSHVIYQFPTKCYHC